MFVSANIYQTLPISYKKLSIITTKGHLVVGMELVVGCSGRASFNEETSCQETEVGNVSRDAQTPVLKAEASTAT